MVGFDRKSAVNAFARDVRMHTHTQQRILILIVCATNMRYATATAATVVVAICANTRAHTTASYGASMAEVRRHWMDVYSICDDQARRMILKAFDCDAFTTGSIYNVN